MHVFPKNVVTAVHRILAMEVRCYPFKAMKHTETDGLKWSEVQTSVCFTASLRGFSADSDSEWASFKLWV